MAGLLVAALGCSGSSGEPTPALPPAYLISGTVSGDVQAGVTVRIQGGRSATTDAGGQYRLRGVLDGTYTLEATLDGYTFTPATRTVTVSGASVANQDFTSSEGLSITGTISGGARSGVTVSLTSAAVATRTATTDADGNYRFSSVTPGVYLVTPALPGGWTFSPANALVTVVAASLGGPDFAAVAPTHGLSGRVAGPFVSGVVVTLSGAASATAVTDGTGRYAFTGLAPGDYQLTPSRPGAAFSPASRSATVASADVTGQDFVSSATHTIAGRVSGDALEGVAVTLTGAADVSTTTDATGYFEFPDLADGSYTVTPALAGHAFTPAARTFTLTGADVGGLAFAASAAPTHSVSGSIGGAVLAGVTVALQGATTAVVTTDAAGAFSLDGVAPGDYLLVPLHEDYTFDPASRFVVVDAADVAGQAFTAAVSASARTISGTVTGAATAGVSLTLVGPSPAGTVRTVATDGTGAFAFRGLGDGQYVATPSLPGFLFAPANCLVTVAGPSVSSVQFTSVVAPHAISGRITGAVVAGVPLSLGGDGGGLTTTTAADGTYAFTGLAPGAYTVRPLAPGFSFSPAEAAVALDGFDVSGVDFTAAATHAISGRVTGDVQAGVTVTLSGAAAGVAVTDAAGAFAFPTLPAGGYVLAASLEGFAFEPSVLAIDLAQADVTTAAFLATRIPTFSVAGTVTGVVVEGVTVTLSGPAITSVSAATSATGAYLVTGLPEGSYMAIPSRPGLSFTPASRAFRINGAGVTGQDFTSSPAP